MHLTVSVIAGHDARICNQPGHDVAGMCARFDVKWATHSRGWAHSPANGRQIRRAACFEMEKPRPDVLRHVTPFRRTWQVNGPQAQSRP